MDAVYRAVTTYSRGAVRREHMDEMLVDEILALCESLGDMAAADAARGLF